MQHLYQLLQYSPIFSNHSLWLNSTNIYISCKHSSTHPIPSALSDEDLNLQEANQRQSRSKACAEHHTFLLTQFEILWRPPDPQWGLSASHLTAHWPLTASCIQTLLRRCILALTSLTSLELLLSKVQEQLLKNRSGVARVKHANCCIYLRPSTLSLHQACFRCYASLLLSCEVMMCCFLPSTPVCPGTLGHRQQTTFRANHCKRCTER